MNLWDGSSLKAETGRSRWAHGVIVRRVGGICALLGVSLSAQTQDSEGLFLAAPSGAKTVALDADDDSIVRSREVFFNPDVFPTPDLPAPSVLRLNFFDDAIVDVVLEEIELRSETDYTWVGSLAHENDPGGVAVVVKDDVLVLNVHSIQHGEFQVRQSFNGTPEVREIDASRFPVCGGSPQTEAASGLFAKSDGLDQSKAIATSGPSVFDVLVAYTPAARNGAGGTTAIEALINLAVAEANEAFTFSLIPAEVRLVHMEEVAYTESDSLTDLQRLTSPTDGFMDNVHTLRDTYRADFVSLFASSSNFCGIGWLMTSLSPGFESNAFTVVKWSCATGNYSFAHELGHNLGCHHAVGDTGLTRDEPILYPYSYGWRWTGLSGNQRRSVMAYSPGTRVLRFSNPVVLYDGVPTGVAIGLPNQANNAQTVINSASTAANWRQALSEGDTYEPDNTSAQATPLLPAVPQSHSIAPPGDEDWYSFTLGVSSEVVIETSGASGDTRMWLRDSAANLIETNNNSGIGDFSLIDRVCGTDALEPGTYYVQIDENGDNAEIAQYQISLLIIPCETGSILVTRPNGGEVLVENTVQAIRWTTTGDIGGSDVDITLRRGAGSTTIVASTPDDGVFDWTIPTNLLTSSNYSVVVTSVGNPTIFDESDGLFTITDEPLPKLTVTRPNGGETFTMGEIEPITWTSVGNVGANVSITLRRGTSSRVVAASTPNNGVFDWTVFTNVPVSSSYTIEIVSTMDTSILDQSNASFAIAAPVIPDTITITRPNGGESFVKGATEPILWTSTGNVGSNVKITLRRGTSSQVLTPSTPNDGVFDWIISLSLAAVPNYLIEISSITNPAILDQSNASFALTEPVPDSLTLTAPNGGEICKIGSTETIRWTSSGNAGSNIAITLWRGQNDRVIATSVPNTGTYAWTVPSDLGTSSTYTIEIKSVSNSALVDVSDAMFTIEP